MDVTRTLLKRVVAVGVVLLVVVGGSAGYVGYQYQQSPPDVKSVESEWGEVTEEETKIQTTVVVNNPNSIGLPGVVGVEYSTELNDVTIMQGQKSSVSISPGRNEISIPATMNNTAIARWWVSHVNNGEQSTMTVAASVTGPGGFSQPIQTQNSKFETTMLDSMESSEPRTVTLQGEEFVVLKEQSASWGEADMEETPIEFSATIENEHDYALTLDGIGYVIRMNDVVVGEGQRTDGVTVEPGQTGSIDTRAVIDTKKMADWWASHVRHDESTEMTVAMYGLVERDGELQRVPFELFSQDLQFTTNMLEGGGTSVQPIEGASDDGPSFEQPTVIDSSRSWGEVTENSTALRGSVTLENPNEGSINEFIQFRTRTDIAINDVTVADETESVGSLDSGRNTLRTSVHWNDSATPRWWAKHVNNGEQSTRTIDQRTLADLGFTRLPVRETGGAATFETDILAAIETDETADLRTEDGTKIAELQGTSPSWGQADAQRTPITVDVTIKNTFETQITFDELQYRFTMNDVVVGERTAPESYTIAPGNTRTVTFTLAIDSQKMDEWWVSHIRNDEETTLDVRTSVRVTTPYGSERADVDSLTQSQNFTTDFLAQDEE
jgi:LEA14-like dessication related protein